MRSREKKTLAKIPTKLLEVTKLLEGIKALKIVNIPAPLPNKEDKEFI